MWNCASLACLRAEKLYILRSKGASGQFSRNPNSPFKKKKKKSKTTICQQMAPWIQFIMKHTRGPSNKSYWGFLLSSLINFSWGGGEEHFYLVLYKCSIGLPPLPPLHTMLRGHAQVCCHWHACWHIFVELFMCYVVFMCLWCILTICSPRTHLLSPSTIPRTLPFLMFPQRFDMCKYNE